MVLVAGAVTAAPEASGATVVRRTAGADRFATAAALSQLAFPDGAAVAFVATGGGYADALAGAPAAGVGGGPLLLTMPTSLPAATEGELRRLSPDRIVVLGGPAVVSTSIEEQLRSLAGSVTRTAGANRYATAAEVATSTFDPGVPVAYVASGAGFADALAGGAAGGAVGGPVLLVERDAVPAATEQALQLLRPQAIRVLGGTGAVGDGVVEALRSHATVSRLSGPDRYATAAAVSDDAFVSATSVFLTTGRSFADALAAGPAAAALAAPLLLTDGTCLSEPAADEIDRLQPDVVHLVGGEAALGAGVAALERCGGRSTVDRRDDLPADRWQVHVVYAVPRDGVDRRLDVDGRIHRSVAAFQAWFAAQTDGSRLAIDTFEGTVDVTFQRLPKSDAAIAARGAHVRDEVEALLEDAGFAAPRKLYAVYYDGGSTFACGGGAWPPTLVGRAAVMYLDGEPEGASPCASNAVGASATEPGYIESSMLHEILHTIGVVATCAPNHIRAGHVSDSPSDLMYAGDEPWRPSQLDVGNDDYWRHGRTDCLDLARSAFLDPLPADAQPPPAWL